LDDPFESDALEGMEQFHPDDIRHDVEELQKQRGEKRSYNVVRRLVAAIVPFLLLSAVIYYVVRVSQPPQFTTLPEDIEQDQPMVPKDGVKLDDSAAEEFLESDAELPEQAEIASDAELHQTAVPDSQSNVEAEVEEPAFIDISAARPTRQEHTERQKPGIIAYPRPEKEPAEAVIEVPSNRDVIDVVIEERSIQRSLEAQKSNSAAMRKKESSGRYIAGKITSTDQQPIPGAVVVAKGTGNKAVSNAEGDFQLSVEAEGTDTLEVSSTGYISETIAVDEGDMLAVALDEDVAELSEVVTTGRDDVSNAMPKTNLSLQEYQENIKEKLMTAYPGLSGRLHIQFTVDAQGKTKDFRVLNSLGAEADGKAIQLIKDGPKWQPGMLAGRPIEKQVNLRVDF
jgi:outer membrane biosynthesis protein TonB